MGTFLPVIISGGSGERLWPVSRALFPKPFIRLPDGQSLLQKALLRAVAQSGVREVLTVTNRSHYFKSRSEYDRLRLPDIATSFVLEPVGRNTAPAIAMAALYAATMHGEDTVLLILPADHMIAQMDPFHTAVDAARAFAEQGYLVTFGMQPTRAETGYGYIEVGDDHRVRRFVEKPDAATAARYLADGNHLWNAGMFCFTAKTILNELRTHCPQLMDAVAHAAPADWHSAATRYLELATESFTAIPSISIDYAVMEKSDKVAVVACDIGWNDVGSWDAMSDLIAPDADGNRCVGEVIPYRSANCFVQSNERVVAVVGVKDLMIVDTPDALLVTHRDAVQDVKQIVGRLKEADHTASREHSTVFRPWGSYTVLQESPGFKIKRIEVLPHQKLSLQMHQHRSEHWVVVSGRARVVNGEQTIDLNPSESTYIPAGHKHRLENIGNEPLAIVEVQCGAYLGEDDITRFDDSYGRGSASNVG